jgi:tetratricopeptide (TPR) repeat protein
MARDDWYCSSTWNTEDQELFESKLARSRSSFHRAQYLRIKALSLFGAKKKKTRAVGEQLMHRLLREYPDEFGEVSSAHAALGEYYDGIGDTDLAIDHYRKTLTLEDRGGNPVHGVDQKLADLIIRENLREFFAEADRLLHRALVGDLFFYSQRWDYAVARARLADRCSRPNEAAAFALGALQLFRDNRPAAPRHPTVGLIHAERATLKELETLAVRGDSEAVSDQVERFRGQNGEVCWAWELIAVL